MVTEVSPENIYYAKDLMEAIEIRDITGIKGNFGVLDKRVCLLHSISTGLVLLFVSRRRQDP
jgi:hypothetical protein